MISVKGLSQQFGQQVVLDQLDLEVEAGQIFGLLGKNGAGKSTLINLILDLIQRQEGEVNVFGKDVRAFVAADKRRWGVVGQDLGLIEEFTAREFLEFVAKIYSMDGPTQKERINDLIAYFFEDENPLKKSISSYSTGMRKKVAFCAAVLNTPDLLILDEPFSGLDILAAEKMIRFIKKYGTAQRAVLVSSHDLSYLEKLVSHIGLLDNGQMTFSGTFDEFTANFKGQLDEALLSKLETEMASTNLSWI
ncbi:ABC transporter ATP-binding protein [Persicobacter diffluens]|uniref:ABC transporter n=1 Tax=Persicobacter diffluens TaxID=981 RepID=A0AAN4VYU5_9BACT|nr:ABC transporter [Persicobacter diffluens]